MSVSFASSKLNPFKTDIVNEPREVTFSVQGLNDKPLQQLAEAFSRLDELAAPRRPVPADKARLVLSPDRGYGKSHFLGRFCGTLGPRATKVYIRPFQNPDRAWQSILAATLHEAGQPETPGGSLTQLQALAVATVTHVAADLVEALGIPESQESGGVVVSMLREAAAKPAPPVKIVRRWIEWLAKQAASAGRGARIVANLRDKRIDLLGRETAWLKVLAWIALDEPHGTKALIAAKWLRGEPLEPQEIKALELESADNDAVADATPQDINELSFQRLRGLCLLASFHRPVVLCFDQTEVYAHDQLRGGAFGDCMERLYVEVPNQLTVVTANTLSWERIARHMETPQVDRVCAVKELQGIEKTSALELVTARLQDVGFSSEHIFIFFSDGWLDKLFDAVHECAVRALLKRACKRFEQLTDHSDEPAAHGARAAAHETGAGHHGTGHHGAGQPGAGAVAQLQDLLGQHKNLVRSRAALMRYNEDALVWFAQEIAKGLPGVSVERLRGNKYFSVVWALPSRSVFVAFEGGAHWRRWKGIADEVARLSRQIAPRSGLFYVFRSPDLEAVPRTSWPQAQDSFATAGLLGFQIRVLQAAQVCDIHAAYQLHAEALEGDIDCSADATLKWLHGYFRPLLTELAERRLEGTQGVSHGTESVVSSAGCAPPPAARGELDKTELGIVERMVHELYVVDIETILVKIGGARRRDAVLRSVEKHPNLKAHPGPKTIYLQWRTTPSARPS